MRLISLCLSVCLVFCFVIPVSAAEEYTYSLVYNEDFNAFASPVSDFPFVAGSSAIVKIDTDLSVSFPSSSVLFIDFVEGAIGFQILPIDSVLVFTFAYFPSEGIVTFSPDRGVGSDFLSNYVNITFISDPLDAYINPITDTIPVVLGWFGLMLTGITSGKLSVLWSIFCVGIAVAVVFVVIKIINRFSWGA